MIESFNGGVSPISHKIFVDRTNALGSGRQSALIHFEQETHCSQIYKVLLADLKTQDQKILKKIAGFDGDNFSLQICDKFEVEKKWPFWFPHRSSDFEELVIRYLQFEAHPVNNEIPSKKELDVQQLEPEIYHLIHQFKLLKQKKQEKLKEIKKALFSLCYQQVNAALENNHCLDKFSITFSNDSFKTLFNLNILVLSPEFNRFAIDFQKEFNNAHVHFKITQFKQIPTQNEAEFLLVEK